MIGAQLQLLRKRRNLSQYELAKRTHLSLKSIKNWEADLSDPNLSSFCCLIDFFGISADELLGRGSSDFLSLAGLDEKEKSRLKSAFQGYLDAP